MRPGPIDWSQAAIGGAASGGEPLLPQGGGSCSCLGNAMSPSHEKPDSKGRGSAPTRGWSPSGEGFSKDRPAKRSKPRPENGRGASAQKRVLFREPDYGLQSIPQTPTPGCDWVWDIRRPELSADFLLETQGAITEATADAEFRCWPTFDPGADGSVTSGSPHMPPTSGATRLTSGFDYAYSSAPPRLRHMWPEAEWAWDDPSCTWLYLQVGRIPAKARGVEDPAIGQCVWDNAAIDLYVHDDLETFVALGMMPYAVYHVRSETTIQDESREERTAFRIRYWVGFINHFSFYPGVDDVNYLDTNMPEPVWGSERGEADPIGDRVEWFMSFLAGLQASLVWEEDGELMKRQRTYYCSTMQEAELEEAYNLTSDRNRWPPKDDTNRYCFSNPENYVDGWMSSLLGECIMGEVCVATSDSRSKTIEELAAEGFEALFGDSVNARLKAFYFDPPGEATTINSRNGLATPARAALRACITANDLETVDSLRDRVRDLRSGNHGRWMFRSFDANLLWDLAHSLSDRPCASSCPE